MAINEKSVTKEIFDIGIPSFLETMFTTFASIIDSKMVSAMGVTAISAVAVTNQPRLFIFSIFFALNTVTSSLVAKYMGKDDREGANRTLNIVLKLVVVLSIFLSVFSVLLAKPIMIAFANQKDTMSDSITYFRIVMGGMVFNHIFTIINAALRGCGKTRISFSTNAVSCIVNIICNYFLIEGHLGFPALGIKGAALATVIGTIAATIVTIIVLMDTDLFVNFKYCMKKEYKMAGEAFSEIKRLAKSCVTDNITMRLSLLIISGIVARIGSYQMAVYSVGMHLLNVNMALGMGLQTSGVALIGRSYGAEDLDAMNAYKRKLVKISVILSIVLGLIIIASGRLFYGFFDSDPTFIKMGAISCVFIGIITFSQTLKFVYSGCLQGVGAMKEVMIASMVSFAGVNLVSLIFFVLVFHIGIWGVWTSTFLSQSTQVCILYYYIKKTGRFAKIEKAVD